MSLAPRVGVGMIIRRGDEVLLVRRQGVHGSGTWSTPGGHLDAGETPEDCALREAHEEVGVIARNVRFLALTNDVFELEDKHYVTIWMDGDHDGSEATVEADYEISEVAWFRWDTLPSNLFLPFANLVAGRCFPSDFLWGAKVLNEAHSSGLHIRRYQPGDQAEVWELHEAGLHQTGAHQGAGPWDDDLADITNNYLNAGGEFLIGLVEGRIVAMGALRRSSDGRPEIKRMRVDPEYQRRGFGRRVLQALETRAWDYGHRTIRLETTTKQLSAMSLYESSGYCEMGRRQWRDAEIVLYEKDLSSKERRS